MPGLSPSTSRFLATHPVFRLDEFRAACGEGRTDQTVRARIKQFMASGRLKPLFPGLYAVTPLGEEADSFGPDPLLVASRLAHDSVLAFHSAFEALGFAHQPFSRVTYLTRAHRRTRLSGANSFVALAPPARLGEKWRDLGTETVLRGGLPIRTTGRERTLADCLARPQYSGGLEELLACVGLLPSLDFELLESYLLALGSPTLFARVGFVLERFADRLFFDERWRTRFASRLPKSPAYLLQREPGNVLVRRWQLLAPPSLLEQEESVLR